MTPMDCVWIGRAARRIIGPPVLGVKNRALHPRESPSRFPCWFGRISPRFSGDLAGECPDESDHPVIRIQIQQLRRAASGWDARSAKERNPRMGPSRRRLSWAFCEDPPMPSNFTRTAPPLANTNAGACRKRCNPTAPGAGALDLPVVHSRRSASRSKPQPQE